MKKNNELKNDNRLVEFTILILLITIIAISLVAGTFAKYTTSVNGSSTATVAKWAVKLNGTDATTQTEEVEFDLFKKDGVFDLKEVTNANDLSGETGVVDEDVVKSGSKVAPGTWGKVAFEVSNESDVSAEYVITINSLETTLPLKFSTDGKTWKSVSEIKTAMATNTKYDLGGGTLAIGSTTATTGTVELYWKWDFNVDAATDTSDTTLGTAGSAQCKVGAGVVFTQVD